MKYLHLQSSSIQALSHDSPTHYHKTGILQCSLCSQYIVTTIGFISSQTAHLWSMPNSGENFLPIAHCGMFVCDKRINPAPVVVFFLFFFPPMKPCITFPESRLTNRSKRLCFCVNKWSKKCLFDSVCVNFTHYLLVSCITMGWCYKIQWYHT